MRDRGIFYLWRGHYKFSGPDGLPQPGVYLQPGLRKPRAREERSCTFWEKSPRITSASDPVPVAPPMRRSSGRTRRRAARRRAPAAARRCGRSSGANTVGRQRRTPDAVLEGDCRDVE